MNGLSRPGGIGIINGSSLDRVASQNEEYVNQEQKKFSMYCMRLPEKK